MPCIKGRITNKYQFLIDVYLTPVIAKTNTQGNKTFNIEIKPEYKFRGLIDTGANITGISKKVIDALQLESEGQVEVNSVNNTATSNLYNVNFHLPIEKPIYTKSKIDQSIKITGKQIALFNKTNIEVSQLLRDPLDFDVLIGMNILNNFSMHFYKGEFTICFLGVFCI